MRKNILDEMQEKKLLNIEHNGMWFSFWGLLTAIVVQMCLGANPRQVAGEFAVFMLLCIYILIACMKNGIWDRSLKPTPKTNAVISLIAALAVILIDGIIYYRRINAVYTFTDIVISVVLTGVLVFFLTFVSLQIASHFYKKKIKKLEQECNKDSLDK